MVPRLPYSTVSGICCRYTLGVVLILALFPKGYGGFSVSIDPFFSPSILTFLQKYGVILAVPNIRGGGEATSLSR